ncbi:MAG: iron ABC transporter permease [Planctomycetota bacterium]|nr:MAG: iron ABC transporter permease [Planctomycetota bacterium]REK44459.1 MAG: iron ABC transporter permease [Planctomycetota bacterium]
MRASFGGHCGASTTKLSIDRRACYDGPAMGGTSLRYSRRLARRPGFSIALGMLVLLVALIVMSDGRTRGLLATTAQLAAGVAALSLPTGIFLAVLLARTDLPLRRVLAFALAVQLLLPFYLVTAAWISAFGLEGSFTVWAAQTRPWLDGARGAIWVHAMAAIPWVALIVAIGLRLVEPEIEEAALTATGALWVVLRVTLPRTGGAIGVALLWIVVTTAGEMTATDLFQMRTFAEEIYTAFAATSDTTTASLQLLPGMLLIGGLVAAALIGCDYLLPRTLTRRKRAALIFPVRRWRWPLVALALVLFSAVSGVPLASLIYRAGLESQAEAGVVTKAWSAAKYFEMISLQAFSGKGELLLGREILSSLTAATISAMIVVTLGTLLAWTARAGRFSTVALFLVVAVCLAVPGPLIGKSVIWLLAPFPYLYDSVFAPALAQSVRALPLATLIMWYALASVPQNVLDAAALDGAGWLARLWRVALPMRGAAVTMAVLVAMIVSVGDLSASQLVQVPGAETLANRIFDRLHSGAYDQVCGVSLAVVMGTMIAAILLWRLVSLMRPRTDAPRSAEP